MKKNFCLFVFGIIFIIGFQACATAESSVKGTTTTIDTLGGDSYEAIILLENIWESAKIARSDGGVYILYVNIMTNGSTRPGSVIIYTDRTRHTITGPTDWNLDDVSVSQYGTAYYRSTYKILGTSIIEAMKNANVVSIRAIGGNAYMGRDEGVNISNILPALKRFISR